MDWNEIRRRARQAGISTRNRKKADLIRALQRAEGNFDCFGRAEDYCDRFDCAWRDDCLKPARSVRRRSA